MTNPLAPIMQWYGISLDCMNLTTRVIKKRIPGAIIRKYAFHNRLESACLESIEGARRELDDLVVLSLVATFERTLRDFVAARPGRILAGGNSFEEATRSEILKDKDIEYWNLPERLIGVFGDRIDGPHRGLIKQVIGYRNWVAHGKRSDSPPDGMIKPQAAFKNLSEFLLKAGVVDSI